MKTSSPSFAAELTEPFALPADAISFYRKNGYVKLKHVLDPDLLAHYSDLITDEVFRLNTLTKPMAERTTYERAFLQVMNLWRESDDVRTFVFSKRLARIATELMGVGGVRLYHDQALYKEPSGGITPWHADQYYWPLSSTNTTTVWIPLQSTPLVMGPLAFAEASQDVELGRDQPISDESEQLIAQAMKQFSVNEAPFDLGEVSYHAGWTFHRAGANRSDTARKVMTMIYIDKDIRITEPDNDNRVNDWQTWLSSKPAGTVADGELNPVLYELTNPLS